MNDQNNDGNPFDQYYEDDDNTQAQEPPRQAPAHLNTQPQQTTSQPTQTPTHTTPTTQKKTNHQPTHAEELKF